MRRSLTLAACLIATPALAIPVQNNPFSTSFPAGGITSAQRPALAGTVQSDTLTKFTCGPGGASGTVQVRVVKAMGGFLDFYWKINNQAGAQGKVTKLQLNGFPKVVMESNWRSDGLGTVAPTKLTGAMDPGYGWALNFEFAQPLAAGVSSRFFFVATGTKKSKPATARVFCSNGHDGKIDVVAPDYS